MEVVPMRVTKSSGPDTAVGLPFNRRNVEEWSRVDRLTGIMEKAKIETDHWAARTSNAAHNYGKVVDSRERNNADGSLQERQRKQMEVFQTKVPGGSMQVIRTQTITTSSKKWSSSSSSSSTNMNTTSSTSADKSFDDLLLPINSLDLTSQKTKGSVGRSGSIGGRRPPTRPRSLISQSTGNSAFEEESSVFRLCHRLHEQTESAFRHRDYGEKSPKRDSDGESECSGVVITDVTDQMPETSVKSGLCRQKSCSNENLSVDGSTDSLLRRSSKIRRSLQCHRQNGSLDSDHTNEDYDFTPTKSLKERAAEIEKLLGRGGSQPSLLPDKQQEFCGKIKFPKTKDSFVSAETLKEVRERLKKPYSMGDSESKDDGIETEKNDYGLSASMNGHDGIHSRKPNINGTGSLESKYSNRSSANSSRTSEWYRRRKSYGFEQVDEYDKFDKFNGKKKNHMDSSTDSGICQSSETMSPSTWTKNSDSIWTKINPEGPSKKDPLSNVVTVRVKKDLPADSFNDRISAVNSVYLDGPANRLSSRKAEDVQKSVFRHSYKEEAPPSESVWTQKSPIPFSKFNDPYKSSLRSTKNPWLSQLRGTKLVDRNWGSDEISDDIGDVTEKQITTSTVFDRKEDSNGDLVGQKKSKKVEFCKTEVHFAAESGKFNIVETDGKPPPNDIFRRRRRSTGSTGLTPAKDTNGLPELKFGDSPIEKTMLTSPEKVESISEKIEAELKELSRIVIEALPQVEKRPENPDFYKRKNSFLYDVAEESVLENEIADLSRPRGILKQNPGFGPEDSEHKKLKAPESNEMSRRSPLPVWQSTVVLRNKRFDDVKRENDDDRKLYSSDGESELQIRIRNLRKTEPDQNRKLWNSYSENRNSDTKRHSLPDDVFLRSGSRNHYHNYNNYNQMPKLSVSTDEMPTLSVAERIKQVEQLKSNNYSTKINFRSGEMTVVQNGASQHPQESRYDDSKKTMTSWANQRKIGIIDESAKCGERQRQPILSCDTELTGSNPPVTRFPTHADKTDNQKYQTTRILINFKTTSPKNEKTSNNNETNSTTTITTTTTTTTTPTTTTTSTTATITTTSTDRNQPGGKLLNHNLINNHNNQHHHNNKNSKNSQSSQMNGSCGSWLTKKDLTKYLNELKSASLVRDTIHSDVPDEEDSQQHQREDIPKLSKPVHEIVDQFDSLSRSTLKEKRRKPVPYSKTSKEYTQSDLEEELKNFTENLDKDFRDIYEEEIGSFRKSRSLRETRSRSKVESPKVGEALVCPIIRKHSSSSRYFPIKSFSGDEAASKKSSLQTSSRDDYDTDDSDLLADEEVRSYMSTGHGGSESETEGSGSRKSFRESILRFKKLESQTKEEKEIKSSKRGRKMQTSTTMNSKANSTKKYQKPTERDESRSPRIASISLKYQDDPFFSKQVYHNLITPKQVINGSSNEISTDAWDRTSNSSSAMSATKPRERVSYLNDMSLSEKYSKYLQRSSNSSMDTTSDATHVQREEKLPPTMVNGADDEYQPQNRMNDDTNEPCYANTSFTREHSSKSHKEKHLSEKLNHQMHATRSEHVESSRRRLRMESDKPSSQITSNDNYQIKQSSRSNRREATARRKSSERNQTDGDLEELKKAAEEILMAVNGYTDDSSHVGSSDDDKTRRIIRKDKLGNLGTISEGKRITKTETRKAVTTHAHSRMTRNHSSASSTESLHKELHRTSRESKTSSRHRGSETNSAKPSSTSRTSRSLHRATREAVIRQPSSSEDIPSCVEQVKRRVIRRQKTSSSSKPEITPQRQTSSSRHRSRSRGTETTTTTTKTTKPEKSKESVCVSRSTRSSRITDTDKDRTKSVSSSKKMIADKSDVDAVRKRRSQRIASREEQSSEQNHKKRVSSGKKSEAFKA